MGALYKGFLVSAFCALIGIYIVIDLFIGMDTSFSSSNNNFTATGIFYCSIIGLAVTGPCLFGLLNIIHRQISGQ